MKQLFLLAAKSWGLLALVLGLMVAVAPAHAADPVMDSLLTRIEVLERKQSDLAVRVDDIETRFIKAELARKAKDPVVAAAGTPATLTHPQVSPSGWVCDATGCRMVKGDEPEDDNHPASEGWQYNAERKVWWRYVNARTGQPVLAAATGSCPTCQNGSCGSYSVSPGGCSSCGQGYCPSCSGCSSCGRR